MGRTIVKLSDGKRDYYLEWSSIVDAPVTRGMTLDELREHVKERYGSEGMRELPERLARVEKHGSSSQYQQSAVDEMWLNRAGKGETRLTYKQIVSMYCLDTGEIRGAPGGDEDWTQEKFDDH